MLAVCEREKPSHDSFVEVTVATRELFFHSFDNCLLSTCQKQFLFLVTGTCFRKVRLTIHYHNQPLITAADKIGRPLGEACWPLSEQLIFDVGNKDAVLRLFSRMASVHKCLDFPSSENISSKVQRTWSFWEYLFVSVQRKSEVSSVPHC